MNTPAEQLDATSPSEGGAASNCPPAATLDAYHDGELSADAAAGVAQHLQTCQACGQARRLTQALSARFATFTSAAKPQTLPLANERLRLAVRNELRATRTAGLARMVRRLTAVAAIILLAGSLLLWQQGGFGAGAGSTPGTRFNGYSSDASSDGGLARVWLPPLRDPVPDFEPFTHFPGNEMRTAQWIVNDLSGPVAERGQMP